MMVVVVVVAVGRFAGPVSELLDNRPGKTTGTFSLKRRVGDVVIVIQHLFESTDNLALTQPVVRLDVNVCRQGRNMRAD